jgi:CheY-like chemotaxis protein
MATSPLNLMVALVVGEHAGIREMVCAILESRNCVVQRARDRPEAMELAAAGIFDLLVETIGTVHADGIGLAEELLAQWPTLKVLLITGRIEDAGCASIAALPNVRFLRKPFDPTELIEAAEQLFAGSQRIRTADA